MSSSLNDLARKALRSLAQRSSLGGSDPSNSRPALLGELVSAIRRNLGTAAQQRRTTRDENQDVVSIRARDTELDEDGNAQMRPVRESTEDEILFNQMMKQMRVVTSSNVYGYFYDNHSSTSGTLYVTFLSYTPKEFRQAGDNGERSGPGATYAYYDFPFTKFKQFQAMAESSAGSAVWDYCRVRHSAYEHQNTYRLVQTSGEYVPRRATAGGYKSRQVAALGLGNRNSKRNRGGMPGSHTGQRQLAERAVAMRQALPDRATANRGEPQRGLPNRRSVG